MVFNHCTALLGNNVCKINNKSSKKFKGTLSLQCVNPNQKPKILVFKAEMVVIIVLHYLATMSVKLI